MIDGLPLASSLKHRSNTITQYHNPYDDNTRAPPCSPQKPVGKWRSAWRSFGRCHERYVDINDVMTNSKVNECTAKPQPAIGHRSCFFFYD